MLKMSSEKYARIMDNEECGFRSCQRVKFDVHCIFFSTCFGDTLTYINIASDVMSYNIASLFDHLIIWKKKLIT